MSNRSGSNILKATFPDICLSPRMRRRMSWTLGKKQMTPNAKVNSTINKIIRLSVKRSFSSQWSFFLEKILYCTFRRFNFSSPYFTVSLFPLFLILFYFIFNLHSLNKSVAFEKRTHT